jgi:hypothetical protein
MTQSFVVSGIGRVRSSGLSRHSAESRPEGMRAEAWRMVDPVGHGSTVQQLKATGDPPLATPDRHLLTRDSHNEDSDNEDKASLPHPEN